MTSFGHIQKIATYQSKLIRSIREFFYENDFLSVEAPPIVQNPGIEPHIHPFQIYSAHKKEKLNYYLHTSPEFFMKRLLSEGLEKIYTIVHSFRDEPTSVHHRQQFLMLEWYRAFEHYSKIMDDSEKLITRAFHTFEKEPPKFQRASIQEIFLELIHIDILDFLDFEDLYNKISLDFKEIPLPKKSSLDWNDLYHLLFLNKVEPQLKNYTYLLLFEFPHHLSALSTIKKDNPKVCERFEIFMDGMELCNCFNELTDLKEQKSRALEGMELKSKLYGYKTDVPKILFNALEKGIPSSAGNALGIERLLSIIIKDNNTFIDNQGLIDTDLSK